MKSFVINLINEYANWGDLEKMKLCKQSSSTATTLVLTALNATLFLLHITKRVKMLKTEFLILFLVNLLGGGRMGTKFFCYIKVIEGSLVSQTRYHKIIRGMWRK